MRRYLLPGAVLLLAAAWWLGRPLPLDSLPAHTPDLANGERMFDAGGCAGCHATAGADDRLHLGGGMALDTRVGRFLAPNISPHLQAGIGAWSALDFANAMLRGLGPDGRHLYPAFPYTSYARMQVGDVLDLKAFLDTLPAVDTPSRPHELQFPWTLRRGIGLWKRLYLEAGPVVAVDPAATEAMAGRYLAEGPGHCGECHTPRDAFQGLRPDRWLAGAPLPDGEGRAPDLTPAGLADWSAADIGYYLETGTDPEYDVVGGAMAEVQENLARLRPEDRAAIAAYLKALPGSESKGPERAGGQVKVPES